MPLSEHVYCVTIAFKMIEWVEQQISIQLCVKLEHSSAETVQVIPKASAMGNWWLAASLWQHSHSRITSCAEFFGETSNQPGDSTPLQPRFGALWLLAFPKTQITFEKEKISEHWWDSGKYDRSADGNWENCVRSHGAYFDRDWGVIVLCTMFFVSASISVSIFHRTWLDTFWTDLVIPPEFSCPIDGHWHTYSSAVGEAHHQQPRTLPYAPFLSIPNPLKVITSLTSTTINYFYLFLNVIESYSMYPLAFGFFAEFRVVRLIHCDM